MGMMSLAVPGLRDEWMQMRQGALYWLAGERAEDSVLLARQVLAGMADEAQAILVVCGDSPDGVLDGLAADRGPGTLWPYAFAEEDAAGVLRVLGRELRRLRAPRGMAILLLAPASIWDSFDAGRLEAWCAAQHAWLAEHGCTLLVLSHAGAPMLCERLQGCSEPLAGLAQLLHSRGAPHYQLHYWRNALGVQGAGEMPLARRPDGFVARPAADAAGVPAAASDQYRHLARRAVLEGAPPLSAHWRLFDDDAALLAAAEGATAACVIFSLDDNARVGALAEHLHHLRRRRGRELRLVVREMAPCLRYLDEQLLLACGASLIVPCGTSLSRFLTLLDSLHGHRWTRTLPEDLPAILARLRPPAQRGLLPRREFEALVGGILAAERHGEVSHLLLHLRVAEGLNLTQVLGQCRLRRAGDLACASGGDLWLFLFGCRLDALERALGNLFRLPWRELFAARRLLAGVDEMAPGADDAELLPALLAAERAPAPAARLTPVRIGRPALESVA